MIYQYKIKFVGGGYAVVTTDDDLREALTTALSGGSGSVIAIGDDLTIVTDSIAYIELLKDYPPRDLEGNPRPEGADPGRSSS